MKTKFWLSIVSAGCCMFGFATSAVEIIGHRGSPTEAPENTLSSFKLAYQTDGCELDIWLSKDGKVTVIHDPDTERTTGVKLNVNASNYEDLRRMDLGQPWKSKGFTDKIPLLEEVLPLIPKNRRLFIDVKDGPQIYPEVGRVLKAAKTPPEQTALIGFAYEWMKIAKQQFPKLQVYWLVSDSPATHTFPLPEYLIKQARAAHFDGVDLDGRFPITAEFVQKFHDAGLKVYTWTVDDVEVAKKEVAAGVDGITTNRPGWLQQQLSVQP